MKFLKNLIIVLLIVGAVGGIISVLESSDNGGDVYYEDNTISGDNYNDDYYQDNYYDDSNNGYVDNNYNNNYVDNNVNSNTNNETSSGTTSGTSFREKGQANMKNVKEAIGKVSSDNNVPSNNQTSQNNASSGNTSQNNNLPSKNQSGVTIVQIDGNNKNNYDGKYDKDSPNYAGTNQGSTITTKPSTNTTVTTKPNTNTNNTVTTKPNTNTNNTVTTKPNTNTNNTVTTKPNTNTNNTVTTKPNTNTNNTVTTKPNTNTNTIVTQPSTGGTSPSVASRVPLDTTGDYTDIVLTGTDRNDITMMEINKNSANKLSTLTGYEEPLRTAVGVFNAFKHEDKNALSKFYYNGKVSTNLEGYGVKYIAYKVVEYHQFSQNDIDKAEKSARILMEIDDSAKITGYYRITMKVFQKDRKVNIINNETKTPFYLTITLMEVDGTPYIYSWMTRQ